MKTFRFHHPQPPEAERRIIPMSEETAGEVFHLLRALEMGGDKRVAVARRIGPLVLPEGFPQAGQQFELSPDDMEGPAWNRTFRTGLVRVGSVQFEAVTHYKAPALPDEGMIDWENPRQSFTGHWTAEPEAVRQVPVEDVTEIIRQAHLAVCVFGEE